MVDICDQNKCGVAVDAVGLESAGERHHVAAFIPIDLLINWD